MKGGAYWYVGNYDPVYYDERPRYVVVNDAYAPIVYTRPVVDVTIAPPAFRGEIVAVGPGWPGRRSWARPCVSAGVYVAAPPPPVVQIGVGVNLGGPAVRRRDGLRASVITTTVATTAGTRTAGARRRPRTGWRGAPPPAARRVGVEPSAARPLAAAPAVRRPPQHGGAVPRRARAGRAGGGLRGGPAPAAHAATGRLEALEAVMLAARSG